MTKALLSEVNQLAKLLDCTLGVDNYAATLVDPLRFMDRLTTDEACKIVGIGTGRTDKRRRKLVKQALRELGCEETYANHWRTPLPGEPAFKLFLGHLNRRYLGRLSSAGG